MSPLRRRSALAATLAFLLAGLSTGSALAQRDPPPPPALQAEFRTFVAGFRQALRANDASAVAALTRLPMHYDDAWRDRAYFESRIYRPMFTQRNRTCLQTARPVYDKDGEGNESFFLFCSGTIFIFTKKADGFRFDGTHPDD
jgi:alpha-ketoglutarate-dependent taurine dioxygenase